MSKPEGYSRIQITLHWTMAILIVTQFVLHDAIVDTFEAIGRGETPVVSVVAWVHIGCGILILALGLWRLTLRLKRGAPALPEKEHVVFKGLAHLTHWLLYLLMILMPISGLATWYGGSAIANLVHTTMKVPLLILVLLHFAAALFQQFYLRTGLIGRMLKAE